MIFIDHLLNLFSAAVILASTTVLGMELLRRIVGGQIPLSERLIFGLGLGMATLSYCLLLLGSLGLAYRATGFALVGVASLIGWRYLLSGVQQLPERVQDAVGAVVKLDWPARLLLAILVAGAIFTFISMLAPPTGSDDLNYHFALPKIFLESHHVGYVQTYKLSTTPFVMEMQWLLGMMWYSATVGQVINWTLGLALAATAGLLAYRYHSVHAGLLAATLVYGITAVGDLSIGGSVELGSALFLVGAILAVVRWTHFTNWRWLLVAGLLAGAFASSKLPNFVIAGSLVVALSVYAWKRFGWRLTIRHSLVVGSVILLLLSPWLIRAWVLTGNPVYPFLPSVFGGRDLPAVSTYIESETGPVNVITSRSDPLLTPSQFFEHRNPLRFLASPWTLTVDNDRFRGLSGPIFLLMLPAVVLWCRRFPQDVRLLLFMLPFIYVGWWASYPMLRTALPIFLLLSIPTSMAFIALSKSFLRIRWVMAVMVVGWLGISLLNDATETWQNWRVVVGVQDKDAWLTQRLAAVDRGELKAYAAFRYINEELPSNAKVLSWESRNFYLDRQHLRVYEFMYGLADADKLASSDEVVGELRRWGITHVAMTNESKRLWLRESLEKSGQLVCTYEDAEMVVCGISS